MSVAENAKLIRNRIAEACDRSGRNANEVKLIAVTKYVSDQTTREALEAGIRHIGENRLVGFLNKRKKFNEQAIWHFIGTLQSRKVKEVIDDIDYLHSLDRLSLAKEIEKRAEHRVQCLVQVNVSGEGSKHGVAENEAVSFIEKLADFKSIEVVGLMTMAPHITDKAAIRSVFRRLRLLAETVSGKNWAHAPCKELSMGMSNDYEIAVEEGATFVRIGTSLVGKEL